MTEQLSKCCESLQKLRVNLGPYKTGLTPPPPAILYYCSRKGDSSVVVLIVLCFVVDFLCCLHIMKMYVLIFSVMLG